jgi:exodeoxyribonuclease III
MLRILSWNIQQGGGSRQLGITNALAQCGYEIIQLSEFKNNDAGSQIRSALLRAGYIFQFVTTAKSDENSVLIASKLNGESKLFPNADPIYTHNIIGLEFPIFTVIGVYLPHKQKHKLFSALTHFVQNSPKPVIVVGDYNTGKNHVDQKGDSFWYQPELGAFEKSGMSDAFRHLHHKKEEYSWFSHQGNGYRYDHTYVSENLLTLVKKCEYLHAWRENGLSDHSPMVLELA